MVVLVALAGAPGNVHASTPSVDHSVVGDLSTIARSSTSARGATALLEGSGLPFDPSSAGEVADTIFVNYNATVDGNFPSAVWDWDAGNAVVDPQTGNLWIPEYPTTVDGIRSPTYAPALVYNLTTNATTIDMNLTNASALAWNPIHDLFYATDPVNDTVFAFNPRTESTVGAAIHVGLEPDAIVYDPNSQNLFVANYGSANVTIINGTSDAFVSSGLDVGSSPTEFADDTADHFLYVAEAAQVAVISTVTDAAETPIPLGTTASSIAYSLSTDTVAVAESSTDFLLMYNGATEGPASPPADVGVGVVSVVPNQSGTEFITTNDSAPSLSIVNASSHDVLTIHPTIAADSNRLTLDPLSGALLVWSASSRIFTLLNPQAVPIQDSPDLGTRQESLAYDPASNRVFAIDTLLDTVSVLNASTMRSAESPIRVPGLPNSVADDASTGIVYVGYQGGVLGVDASTGRIVAENDSYPGNNSELIVDVASDLLWDDNNVSGLIAVRIPSLALSSGTTYGGGRFNLGGTTLDNQTDVLYFVDTSNASVVAVNGAGGALADSPAPAVIPGLISVAYDSADNAVYALGQSVWILNPATLAIEAGPIPIAPHTVAWTISYDPSREYLYVTSNSSSEPWPGNVTVLDGASVNASSEGYVALAVGQLPLVTLAVALPGATARGSSELWVTNYISGTISVIASLPSVQQFAALPDPVDLGASTTLLLAYSGGAGAASVTYSGLPAGCASADLLALACVPTEIGTYGVTAEVTDSLGRSVNVTTELAVDPEVVVTPSFYGTSDDQVDVGHLLDANATVAGGSAPYNYSWNFDDGVVLWGDDVSTSYTLPGTYLVTVEVRDAGGGASVNTTELVVEPLPTVALHALPSNETDVGVPIGLSADVGGGTTPGIGSWEFGDGESGVGESVQHAYTESGVYFARFYYVDASGVNVSQYVQIVVHPSIAATFSVATVPSGTSVDAGTLLYFNTTISGGTAPYTVVWGFQDGSYGYGVSAQHIYGSAGTYRVTLFVVDSVGGEWNTTYRLVVGAAPSASNDLAEFESGLVLGAIVGAVVAAVALFVAGRSRKPGPPSPPSAYVPPAPVKDEPNWREE